ncbi:MAG TPA: hypothetical protein VHZ50_04030, partial [Puia sp.]|nr:hypothetical protein [Puia sp.]
HDIIVPTWSFLNLGIAVSYCVLHFFYISAFHGSLARSLWRMHDMAHLLLRDEIGPIDWMKIGQRKYIHWRDLPFEKISVGKKLLALWGKLQTWDYLQIGITLFLVVIYLFVSD